MIADWYASQRTGHIGVPEVAALAASLPAGASVLDVGCGTGLPLTRVLLEHGCHVVGVDSSRELLARFQANFPHVPVVCAPIQSCELQGRMFDAAIAWGVLFHLNHEEQAQAIANIASALRPGAVFLFTSGDVHGSTDGAPMNGVAFRYHSYSVDGYRELLRARGLTLEAAYRDPADNFCYQSRKTG
ncbi:class I SAM-dependent methyltransferase [Myxococcus stipitatus]|uniref:class I SAM-dependent methyltransferase n=1 Tax=Myxococcus stipitatus TaxID=83455 RepID=UPI0030CCEE10